MAERDGDDCRSASGGTTVAAGGCCCCFSAALAIDALSPVADGAAATGETPCAGADGGIGGGEAIIEFVDAKRALLLCACDAAATSDARSICDTRT